MKKRKKIKKTKSKIRYTKKAQLNILRMARVESMLREGGINKLDDIKFKDGRYYVGEFEVDKKTKRKIPNGLGFMIWPDGSSYNGTFYKGKFEDFGEYESAKSKKKMGIWKNGKFLYKQGIDDF